MPCNYTPDCPALATHGSFCAVHYEAWLEESRTLFAADVKAGKYNAEGYTPAETAAKDRRRQMSLF